jgi:hypothetical protein
MIDTKHDAKACDLCELTSDQLDGVSGGNDTANAIGYFLGEMIGEAAGIVKQFGLAKKK